ncbi:MAG TPA: serine hydrolase domain-containing protein [Herpetosiphonaceae bacterium]|nr:serine hydrolase domain-containing protein [Herpetosiphonaceae bacterium]
MNQRVETPESAGMSAARLERIRPVMQSYVDQNGYGGISTMISRRGKVIYADQVGWQDREAGVPLAEDTIFRIYSMTKPVIYTALMTLYEQARFQLIDPVAKFIPAFGATKVLGPDGALSDQPPLRPMQVRDLMTHCSGLSYDFLEEFPVAAMYRDARLMNDASRSLEAVVEDLARIPLAFQPGTRWHYSLGTDVAAHLIQVLSDKPLDEFMRERLFTPLGMDDTDFRVPEAKRSRLAAMYGHPDVCAEGMTISTLFGHFMSGNSGRREVDDTYPADAPGGFLRGGIGLHRGRLPAVCHDAAQRQGRGRHAHHRPQDSGAALLPYGMEGGATPGYGFGLGSRVCSNVAEAAISTSVGEFGWAGAAKTYYWVDPQEELVGLLMTQFMMGFDLPENDLRTLVYQAIED